MDETQEIIKEQLKKLPEDVRKAFASVDLRAKIKKISEKHRLHIDQGGELENETVLVMLGLESANDYKINLKRGLQISNSRAQAIIFDIDKEIFVNIRESLKKISQEDDMETEDGKQDPINHPSFEKESDSENKFADISVDTTNSLNKEKNTEEDKKAEESEEIKMEIARWQIIKPSVPPPNLPTEKTDESPHSGDEFSSKKKPFHIDPYRELID